MVPIEEIEGIVRAAAAVAVNLFGRVTAERKRDGSLVTEADRASQRLIVQRLREREPDSRRLYILAEEQPEGAPPPNADGADSAEAEYVAAVDPVDGTTAFASGLPFWTVSLGILRRGRPVAGVIYAPLVGPRGWLFRVGADGPPTLEGTPTSIPDFQGWKKNSQIAVTSGAKAHARFPGFPGKVRSLGSTAHHLALVAGGMIDAAVVGRAWCWDLAAGAALIERAGGVLETFAGGPPDWDTLVRRQRQPEPLLIGSPGAVAALRAFLP